MASIWKLVSIWKPKSVVCSAFESFDAEFVRTGLQALIPLKIPR